ncbi:hypothetical protein N7326_07350 [Corynebacterium sp. ES2794-CONJ1]|uniref:hypothetical protein n=1 Tax=unclassified Corynebacterium TaxID=2624378 RepID=UPI00216AFB34|nr:MULTISPECIES: hypothetical protein [unclassified Corynebacterium]MCS4532356.1 hypothetical protein [Corynebacterium sp. ES2730-CONJ]MCU9519681.1 hypothetical protein [Corynebacterium sp. ES2794-CONJ1]
MFGLFKKKQQPQTHVAAERTNLPMSDHMTRLVAEELPLLDSDSRGRIYSILESYEGPTITSQEELPEEIRRLLDL